MTDRIKPETCAIDGCDRIGEALVQEYAPAPGPYGYNEPTGNWIWLCDEHVRQEFA